MQNSPKQKIIFDMDGVIIDSEPVWHQAAKKFVQEQGVEYDVDFEKTLAGIRETEAAQKIKDHYNLEADPESISENRHNLVRNLHHEKTRLFPGVKELLSELEENHYTTALVTSSSRALTDYILAKFDLRPYFDYVITSDDVENGKPHPEPYQKAAQYSNTAPEQCVVLEDSYNGLMSAREAGMKTIHVEQGNIFDLEKAKEAKPTESYKTIEEISLDSLRKILNGNRD